MTSPRKGLEPSNRPLLLPVSLVVGAFACGGPADDARFGADARRLDTTELAEAKGGVAVSVIKPTAGKKHYIDNPKLEANVYNSQSESQTTLYLHHGTSKTGSRVVATPAPGYTGQLRTRFKHLGPTDDLVIKFRDASNGSMRVAGTVPGQRLAQRVRLHRIVFHNVTTTVNATNVGGPTLATIMDSRRFDQSLAVSDSVDRIFAQCPSPDRVQFQIEGLDDGMVPHRIVTGTNKCSKLHEIDPTTNEARIYYDDVEDEVVFDDLAKDCMQELFNGALAMDPTYADFHVFIVKDLQSLKGFATKLVQGVVIEEDEFNEPVWRQASLVAHELSHSFGNLHRAKTDPECNGNLPPHERALMCSGLGGKKLNAAECQTLYTGNPFLVDYR